VKLVPQYLVATPEHLANTLTLALELGYEGLILRSPHAPYKYGRSTLNQGWMLKLKEFLDAEAEIIGIEELLHNENPAEIGELGQTKHSHEKAGLVGGGVLGSFVCRWRNTYFNLGTGFNAQQRKEYYTKDCIGKLAKFKYQGVGPNNKPRFPVFLGFRHKDDL
jgi:DNA ligase-1